MIRGRKWRCWLFPVRICQCNKTNTVWLPFQHKISQIASLALSKSAARASPLLLIPWLPRHLLYLPHFWAINQPTRVPAQESSTMVNRKANAFWFWTICLLLTQLYDMSFSAWNVQSPHINQESPLYKNEEINLRLTQISQKELNCRKCQLALHNIKDSRLRWIRPNMIHDFPWRWLTAVVNILYEYERDCPWIWKYSTQGQLSMTDFYSIFH